MMEIKEEDQLGIHHRVKYRVKVRDHVSEDLSDYYSGVTIRLKDDPEQGPETEIIGWLDDQAALLGMLNLINEWGHSLIYVEHVTVK